MQVYAVLAALAAQWTGAGASPLAACENDGINMFVADDRSLCTFYQCAFGQPVKFACAKGSRVPTYFNKGPSSPCVVKVKNNAMALCDRCNVTDDPIPGPRTYNQCALFRPCDTRPGCTCVDQGTGYYCSCPHNDPPAPTPIPMSVQQCDLNVCQNGGTCYSLYKNKFCNCKPPYTGNVCETNACDELVCNNGMCEWDSFGVFCQCEPCFTGPCCEDRISCFSDCSEYCLVGLNCTTRRINKCVCNPCASEDDICLDVNPSQGARRCIKYENPPAADFTLMFEDNFSNPPYGLEVYVSAASDDGKTRAVIVDAPLMGYTDSAVIRPGEVRKFTVDLSLMHTKTGRENFGIRVRETKRNSVSVYCINRAQYSADGWFALPDKLAGTAYIVMCYSSASGASQFAVVAISNNTVVTINFVDSSADIPGSGKNTSIVVNLNAWQTYQVQSNTSDFTGTSIISNNPIHVYSGEAGGWVGPSPTNPDYDPDFDNSKKSRDNLILQCTSINTWGKTYALVPLPRTNIGCTYTEEAARIVSYTATTCKLYTTTSNDLQFTELTIALSAAGNYYAQFYMNAAYNYFLSCDQPVMLVEITESSIPRCNNYNDPSFIYVPAVYSYSNFYHFVPPVYSVTNSPYLFTYLRLIARESDYSGIEINEEPLLSMALETMKTWTRIYVPGAPRYPDFPSLYGCIVRISSSNPTAVNHPTRSVKFSAIVEGFDDRESYGIALGASIKRQRSSFDVDSLQSSGRVVTTVL